LIGNFVKYWQHRGDISTYTYLLTIFARSTSAVTPVWKLSGTNL